MKRRNIWMLTLVAAMSSPLLAASDCGEENWNVGNQLLTELSKQLDDIAAEPRQARDDFNEQVQASQIGCEGMIVVVNAYQQALDNLAWAKATKGETVRQKWLAIANACRADRNYPNERVAKHNVSKVEAGFKNFAEEFEQSIQFSQQHCPQPQPVENN